MSHRRGRSRLALVATVLLVLPVVAGCVVVPTSGAVRDARSTASASPPPEATFVPRGPTRGQSPEETLDGFFAAMLASPMSASVARRFLTEQDAGRWAPEDGYLTYGSRQVSGKAPELRVRLDGVNRFDARGAWAGSPPGGRLRLRVQVQQTPDGPRLAGVPDALMVSDDWFEQQTDALSVYYLDPAGRSLVAEPVFVPRGAQRATLLVHALLDGPVDPRVERTFVPVGTRLNLSVTLRADGTAEVPLADDLGQLPESSLERLAAQFAATLRQIPEVTRIRLLVRGRPLPVVGDQTTFDVTTGSVYDLGGLYPAGRLFGLRDGRAVRLADGRATDLDGPFGQRDYHLRDLAPDISGEQVAGVSDGGTQLLLAPVGASSDPPSVLLTGRTDLAAPSWDAAGRLWVVDRTAQGAVVLVAEDGRAHAVEVPGVTGRRVTRLLVSADGTRLVAVVRRAGGDAVVQSRLTTGVGRSSVPAAVAATPVTVTEGTARRVRDLAWSGPTELMVLSATNDSSVELDTTLVDGSPVGFDATTSRQAVAADVDTVVGSGRSGETAYVGVGDREFVQTEPGGQSVPPDVEALTYVG